MPMHPHTFLKKIDQHLHDHPDEWAWGDGALARLIHHRSGIEIHTHDFHTYIISQQDIYDGQKQMVISPTEQIDLYAIYQTFDRERRRMQDHMQEAFEYILGRLEKKKVAVV